MVEFAVEAVTLMKRILQPGIISQKGRFGIEAVIIGEFIKLLAGNVTYGKSLLTVLRMGYWGACLKVPSAVVFWAVYSKKPLRVPWTVGSHLASPWTSIKALRAAERVKRSGRRHIDRGWEICPPAV